MTTFFVAVLSFWLGSRWGKWNAGVERDALALHRADDPIGLGGPTSICKAAPTRPVVKRGGLNR